MHLQSAEAQQRRAMMHTARRPYARVNGIMPRSLTPRVDQPDQPRPRDHFTIRAIDRQSRRMFPPRRFGSIAKRIKASRVLTATDEE